MDRWEALVRGRWCGHRHPTADAARACGPRVENRNPLRWGVNRYSHAWRPPNGAQPLREGAEIPDPNT